MSPSDNTSTGSATMFNMFNNDNGSISTGSIGSASDNTSTSATNATMSDTNTFREPATVAPANLINFIVAASSSAQPTNIHPMVTRAKA
ncbi:hypothetical protein U1Q18_026783, partial [Sarracenia purpurea var. burkii]